MKITNNLLPNSIKLSPELEKVLNNPNSSINEPDSPSFGDMLASKIKETDQMQKAADTAVTDFATGKSKNLHEAVLALEMADTSLRMMVTVRNKALDAYQEIMKMPV